MSNSDETSQKENLPPFFKKWKTLYLFVLGFLGSLIIMFKLFTDYYS